MYTGLKKSKSVVEKSIYNSLCFGIYLNDKQVGFARVITSDITLDYLLDVLFILEQYRGKGFSTI